MKDRRRRLGLGGPADEEREYGEYAAEKRKFIASMTDDEKKYAVFQTLVDEEGAWRLSDEEANESVDRIEADGYLDRFLSEHWNAWAGENIHADHVTRKDRWVNIYLVDRVYGGPEEGGWWYTAGEPVESIYVPWSSFDEAAEIRDKSDDKCEKLNEGRRPISSVLSEGEYQARIEDHFAEPFPSEQPHYE